jgi:RHH-type proline utilization regulon transcriptional repressor/proline dehydrogenase/delta 1-pyrroline-5-carboxylate dehydrogenase
MGFLADYSEQMREAIRRQHRVAEAEAVERLRRLQPETSAGERITETALRLARRIRETPPGALSAESFLRSYGLTTREGVALMCVAEALLRIPDADTQDALIRDKLASGSWSSASAADWALMLTGTLARWHHAEQESFSILKQLVARLGEPLVRTAVRQAMRILAGQFVLAETIEEAVARAAERRPYRFSFDMLGEAARTSEDAERYSSRTRARLPPSAPPTRCRSSSPHCTRASRKRSGDGYCGNCCPGCACSRKRRRSDASA